MTSPAALQWLCEEFEPALRRYQRQVRARSLDENWHGPSVVRPMIQLRSLHDCGKAMTISQADYHDPDRRWL
jgi:hypothetical protein